MSKTNGIHIHLGSNLLLPQCGAHWIPLPDQATLATLTEEEATMLRTHVGPQDKDRPGTLGVAAPTWDAVIMEIRQKLEEARAEAARCAARNEEYNARQAEQEAEKDARATRANKIIPRILAGEGNLDSPTCHWIEIDNEKIQIHDLGDRIDREPLHAEYQRRTAVAGAQAKAAQKAEALRVAAAQATIIEARTAWLVAHDVVEDVRARHQAGVLPPQEWVNLLFEALPNLADHTSYQLRRADDIDHDDDCEDIERRVTWGVEDGDTDPLTATQWRTLQQIRTAVAEMPGAHVDVRRHVARLSCRCADPSWLAARVRIVLPDLDLNVQRQYKLGE